MTNSRQKGKAGELELKHKLNYYGYRTRRGQQYNGANGDADVVGLPGIHIECKRVERLNIEDAMSQAKADTKGAEKPTVMHRKNNCEWLVTMRLDDWIELYREWEPDIKEKETRIYDRYCNGCMQEKKCHEECIRCDMVAAIYEWEGM